jgi:hypothetical protein
LDSFESGILSVAKKSDQRNLIHPDYKAIIPPALIRRMGSLIKMGVGAALRVKGDFKIEGVIVGTGLGCIENTDIFLHEFIERPTGTLSPTAFIQSTHNTVAGQIALILKEHGYNSTYTQRGFSFENALMDAALLTTETNGNVLVGGLDESISLFDELALKANLKLKNLGSGVSFFLINQNASEAKAKLMGLSFFTSKPEHVAARLKDFLKTENLESPDLILYGNSFPDDAEIPLVDVTCPVENYTDFCGAYMTNSAFAMQLAAEILSSESSYKAKRILVLNNFQNTDFSFIYLEKP